MKIKGRISQIIEKKDYHNFFSEFLDENFVVVLEKEDFPTNLIRRIPYLIKHTKDDYLWTILLNKCNYKVGDVIEIDAEPIKEQKRLGGIKLFKKDG